MSPAGRPSKPTAMKLLHGDRVSSINNAEPQPAAQEVVMPRWLTPPARKVWKALAPDLTRKGVLTFWDVELFARFCWLCAKNAELMKRVEVDGLLVPGAKGVNVKHPAMQLARDTLAQMTVLGSRFGLTPVDRARLDTSNERDSHDDLFTPAASDRRGAK